MEAYAAGVPTRSVEDLVAALGAESGISKSQVSRVRAGLDDTVEAFRSRRLDHTGFPYVYFDAAYLNVRNSVAQPASTATVVATGVTSDGNREILGCDVGDSETEAFWQQFMGSLRDRGLTGVRLVISDARRGLAAAASRWFQGAARQRCRAHFIRNLLAVVPKTHQHMAAALFRTIFAQPDAGSVTQAREQVTDQLAAGFPKTGPLTDTAKTEVLAFAGFPQGALAEDLAHQPHRRHQQRDQAPIARRGNFPNEASAIRLVGAILAALHDEWQATDRRYLSEDSMSLLYPQRDSLATAELTTGN